MNSAIVFYFDSSSDESEEYKEKIIRKQLRDRSNPLALPPTAFIKRFRLNKEAFNSILSKLRFDGHLSTSLPPILQLASTLALLASGGYKHALGSDFLIGMCQSTISKTTSKVLLEMERKLCSDSIKFDVRNSNQCMEYFVEKYGIPGVIGCIDGTHIALQRPTENEHMFFNRKGHHSLNAMIICDHEFKILAINCQYGGAAHDSFIWKHSDQRKYLEGQYRSSHSRSAWLLGDSGYPLEPWCITPYRSPEEGSRESTFNEVHSKARRIVPPSTRRYEPDPTEIHHTEEASLLRAAQTIRNNIKNSICN